VIGDPGPYRARSDWQSDQEVRWCPGCGDYAVLASMQHFLADLGIERHKVVFVSGIGCSSRFPYYMNTYGFHSIHGRAPAIASGIALANPDLSVWVITGDGDGLSIGGNHLIHAMRRNINIKVLLLNNQIYGLTKGQFSPTTQLGKRTKSSPMGSIDPPFNPISLALGAEATFVARTIDMDRAHTTEILRRAHTHRGAAFVEIYQNCNVFNDRAFAELTGKPGRDRNRIPLQHGKPVIFGEADHKGIVIHEGTATVATVADVGIDAIHIHDEHNPQPGAAFALSRLAHNPTDPTPIGVFRDIQQPLYEDQLQNQITQAITDRGQGNLFDLIRLTGTWTIN
jgi:2-oxoglutarate/2-oxoacid ferredoxin oxidoreductase subunit beta